MPKPKCIAYDTSGKRCKNDGSNNGVWPENVLCGEHFRILELNDARYGFKTQYKGGDENELSLCKGDGSRPVQAGQYYLCSEDNDNTGNGYDVCYDEYKKARMGSTIRTPGSPFRSPTMRSPGLTPRSPIAGLTSTPMTPGGVNYIYNANCNKGEPIKITQSKANKKLLRSVKADTYKEESESESDKEEEQGEEGEEGEEDKKPCEKKGLLYNTFGKKKRIGPYKPKLNCEYPQWFPDKYDGDGLLKLYKIDETRNVNEALRLIKEFMNAISRQQSAAGRLEEDTYYYSVQQNVVDWTYEKLYKHMSNPLRVELVLTFLYDYETRDLFNPMKFYGFSITEPKPQSYLDVLNGTPYAILNAGEKTGYGQIDADIARPRAPSEFFKDKIERIAKVYKAPTSTGTDQQRGGDGGGRGITPGTVPGIDNGKCYNPGQIVDYIKQLANLQGLKIVIPKEKGRKEMYGGFVQDNIIGKGSFKGSYVKELLTSLASKTDASYGSNEFASEIKAWVANAGDDDGPNRCNPAPVAPAPAVNRSTAGLATAINFDKDVNIGQILEAIYRNNNNYKYKGNNLNSKNDSKTPLKKYITTKYNSLTGKTPKIIESDNDPHFTGNSATAFANAMINILNDNRNNKNIDSDSKIDSAINLLEYAPRKPKATPPEPSALPPPPFEASTT